MVNEFWVTLTLLFSLVLGSVAMTLSLLMWQILRESAAGQVVVALTVVMLLFNIYHGLSLLVPQSELFVSVLKSITFTGVALFIALSIRFERRVAGDSSTRGEM